MTNSNVQCKSRKMDLFTNIWQKTNRWHRGILIFLIVELRVIPKQQLGFECNDPALSHTFNGDTISMKWLLAYVVLLPLVVLLLTERAHHKEERSSRAKQQAFVWYKEYLYGVLINLIVVQTLKSLVGAPRPHFFDTCDAKEASTCTGNEYVSSYTCLKGHWVNQSDSSFPSGHTALAVHTGIFIAYYLHRRISHRSNVVLASQVLVMLSAVFCAVSRVTDRRHHWWDVLVGAAVAVPILIYTIFPLCKNFNCPIVSESEDNNTNKENRAPLAERSQETS